MVWELLYIVLFIIIVSIIRDILKIFTSRRLHPFLEKYYSLLLASIYAIGALGAPSGFPKQPKPITCTLGNLRIAAHDDISTETNRNGTIMMDLQ